MDTSEFKDKMGFDFKFKVDDPELMENPEVQEYLKKIEVQTKESLLERVGPNEFLKMREELLIYGSAPNEILQDLKWKEGTAPTYHAKLGPVVDKSITVFIPNK